jgi:uncharacterized protein YbaR (Trm112 family)
MLNQEQLSRLRCPESRQTLKYAEAQVVAKLNESITSGALRNRADQVLDRKLDAGLIREDGSLLYPVIDQIPILIIDEAIELHQVA